MSDKINIAEILDKHRTQKGGESEELMAGIKEIVEAVIDRCVEEATVTHETVWSSQEGSSYGVDKESILQVKQMIDYE